MKTVKWRQICSPHVPSTSGVYAWYYNHQLGDKDIEIFLSKLNLLKESTERFKYIEEFLNRHFFDFYIETPYQVTLKGDLKAAYSGSVEHIRYVSESVVTKIEQSPHLIRDVSNVISLTGIQFSSPLYIGMAKNLLKRLSKHKSLIERYEAEGVPSGFSKLEDLSGEKNFAERVIARNFNITKLVVTFYEIDSESNQHNLIENMLNRINYPILGRN